MPINTTAKAALNIYNLVWSIAIPVLRFNQRLDEGFRQRMLKHNRLSKADLWIQAASAGESYLAWSLLKKLKPNKPVRVIVTSNTSQGLEILERSIADITPNEQDLCKTPPKIV